jgi:hypothetical protein
MTANYPVPNRSVLANRRIAAHEAGHCVAVKCLGNFVHALTIIPDAESGYSGRCIRSGSPSELALQQVSKEQYTTEDVVTICERLERLVPELGSPRTDSAEFIVRAQSSIIELVSGEISEKLLHPELPTLGSAHDWIEAGAFAKTAVAASPATEALVDYAVSEAINLLTQNIDVVRALVEVLVEKGVLFTDEINTIIGATIAERAHKIELGRRNDWRQRERNAATFQRVVIQ